MKIKTIDTRRLLVFMITLLVVLALPGRVYATQQVMENEDTSLAEEIPAETSLKKDEGFLHNSKVFAISVTLTSLITFAVLEILYYAYGEFKERLCKSRFYGKNKKG